MSYKASISSPCAVRDQTEKSISKSTPASSDQGQGHLNCNNEVVWKPLLLFYDNHFLNCLFIHFCFSLLS